MLIVLRHADAVNETAELCDSERHLSGRGRLQAKQIGVLLAQKIAAPPSFVTSPLVRAVQTAELAATAFPGCQVTTLSLLAPSGDFSTLVDAARRAPATTVFVGHEPTLSQLVRALLAPASKTRLGVERGEAIAIVDGQIAFRLLPEVSI